MREHIVTSDTEDWEIDRICGKMIRDGKVLYEVRWLGFDNSANTWLPLSRLNCEDYIEEFENNNHVL